MGSFQKHHVPSEIRWEWNGRAIIQMLRLRNLWSSKNGQCPATKRGGLPLPGPLEKLLGLLLQVGWLNLFSGCCVPRGHLTPKECREDPKWKCLSFSMRHCRNQTFFPLPQGNTLGFVLHNWFSMSNLKMSKFRSTPKNQWLSADWEEWGLHRGPLGHLKEKLATDIPLFLLSHC